MPRIHVCFIEATDDQDIRPSIEKLTNVILLNVRSIARDIHELNPVQSYRESVIQMIQVNAVVVIRMNNKRVLSGQR